ncbi:MAG: response regulator [Magnetococcales bacterium]|nr:response regulator [Magnetococcales bacterium]
MTQAAAARLLKISSRTVSRWVENGTIKAWRTEGGKSRIYLSSVQEILSRREEKLPAPEQPVKQKPSILIVEDQAELLEIYAFNIVSWKLPVRVNTATNGFDALIEIGREKPSLIITDLAMPGMDGFEMIQSLRNHKDLHDLKIMVITILSQEEIEKRGGLPSDVVVFNKPVVLDQLKQVVKQTLKV